MKRLVPCAFMVIASGSACAEAQWTENEIAAMARVAPREQNPFTDCIDREANRLGAGATLKSVKQAVDRACGKEERVLRDALTKAGMARVRADAFISGFIKYR